MEHNLKTWPEFYARIVDGSKTFEFRKNDRGFQQGDTLRLQEFDPNYPSDKVVHKYTGREITCTVGFVLSASPMAPLHDYVVLSLLGVREDNL